jgi:DNA-binding NtrC family response regulator
MIENDAGRTRDRRLLIIDDEKEYAMILAKRLSRRGFEVTTAFSGSEGIQALRYADFDVAVLDLKMEDIDGLEVLKILKKLAPEIAVIMLTGHGSAQAAKMGMEQGAFDYLSKPCELEELVAKLNQACENRERR